ncbi:hypothetical protein ACU611_07770 [Klebsiella aerogenes]|uniref:hypothetical protein n=1 Tax=Enterobacteriaceae TaxID=543 RepID=UPI000DA34333|nr:MULTISPECIES: hypothetical protein [Enterobacteriaceae]EKW3165280.1 hypothetical protein [Shigella dysenteriae]EFB6377506.1 hypothetical protein [Escherichia coli]EHO2264379.1 hypothetical protein [Escherichia coli]EIV3801456.1 hypothetical protein [Klebsiella aerogenes]EIV7213690.1 hypothetical protein [Klebsiella aerogenes]
MTKEHFKAAAQYDDWEGSVAADELEKNNFSDFLRGKGVLKQGEVVKGISLYSGVHRFDVEAYIADDKNLLRKEDIQITLEEFFKTFKRFSIKISRKGEFDDQEIEFKE